MYEEAVDWIFGFTNYEFTRLPAATAAALDLTRLRSLLGRLGKPQQGRQTVHLTGSKGKGSTARMLAGLLERSGARVGLYTSPHLHSPCQRIAIDGVALPENEFAALATQLRPHVEVANAVSSAGPLTTFELLTALAFLAFRERRCDWQVIEVGLGGRLDATNVLDEKALCVFTPISLEHTAVLGSTTAAIAADKAGILRRGSRVVMAPQGAETGAVLMKACAALGVPLASVAAECHWRRTPKGFDGQDCVIRTPAAEYRFFLPLLGGHQVENAATALLGLEQLRHVGVQLTSAAATEALAAVRWPGRLEVVSLDPPVLVDGAHNAASAARLAEALEELCPNAISGAMNRTASLTGRIASGGVDRAASIGGGITLVIGTLADKDLPGIVAALAPVAAGVIAVEPAHPRARPADEIVAAFLAAGIPTRTASSVPAGLEDAVNAAGPGGAVCVAGSLFVAAEARAAALRWQRGSSAFPLGEAGEAR